MNIIIKSFISYLEINSNVMITNGRRTLTTTHEYPEMQT